MIDATSVKTTGMAEPMPMPRMKSEPHGEHAQQGDDDGDAGEDHGPAGGVDGVAGAVLGLHALVEVLAVPGDDEQRVVDADAEADHDGDGEREVGHRR